MKANTVREPKQERSIEKKKRIIQAGYDLFSQKGYHNTNTAEIAKYAKVSTGIIYGYFNDKKDILKCVIEIYMRKITAPVYALFDKIDNLDHLDLIIDEIVDIVIQMHKSNANLHETLHSLTHTDADVNTAFIRLEDDITINLERILLSLGMSDDGLREKIHFSLNIIESFAHEYVYDKHTYIDYKKMQKIVTDIIKNLFKKN